ncbi:MAG: hypothetical protein B5M54_04245 [Candidatus Aminicenantes bacterium 4484_214]|nr:MAG: hypothetical protein B5M54_04245 [Candidatus Aminicenantes bacterium 4484_214]
MPKIVSATTFRNNFSAVIKEVSGKEKYMIVTQKNKPVSAIVDIDFFEDLLALASSEYLESIKKEDYNKGRIFEHKDVFGEL